jgi:uncharacterized protein YbjT (DUF2867 family)
MPDKLSVVMIGATGAVGSHAAKALAEMPGITRLTLLGRRPLEAVSGAHISQHAVDVFDPSSYERYLPGHSSAICTLGVGQPTKVSREELARVDKRAALDFATACKRAGVQHFALLGSVGASAKSPSFFLRNKGELEDGLTALGFARLSLFRPSMILTPTNRYGLSQALTLAIWPRLQPVLIGRFRKYRGIPVDQLGRAIANSVASGTTGRQTLHWDDIVALAGR